MTVVCRQVGAYFSVGNRVTYTDRELFRTRNIFSSVKTTLFHLSTDQFKRILAHSSLAKRIRLVKSGRRTATRRRRLYFASTLAIVLRHVDTLMLRRCEHICRSVFLRSDNIVRRTSRCSRRVSFCGRPDRDLSDTEPVFSYFRTIRWHVLRLTLRPNSLAKKLLIFAHVHLARCRVTICILICSARKPDCGVLEKVASTCSVEQKCFTVS